VELDSVLDATWPAAASERLGPWRLRDGAGGGKRVSAATLEGEDGDPAEAAAAMRARGVRPLFRVREGQGVLDARLAALGYARVDPTEFYAAPAAELAFTIADVTVIDCEAPLAAAAEIWAGQGVGPARLAVMGRVAGPKRFLLGRLDDRPAGAAFVATAGTVAMLHALVVAERMQRRGLGRRLTQGAAAWGLAAGAETFALAVEAANDPARALYEALGMRRAGGYHYRCAPG
jgi:ribosomal protein S18 acetylase RimI-like enzyme